MPQQKKSNKPNLDNYVEVAERVRQFYTKYPDGRLWTEYGGLQYAEVAGEHGPETKAFIWVRAYAARTADDPRPATGMAWEPVPGGTPYTRNSELQNAETSAIGRAIVFINNEFSSRGIASKNEVQNRRRDDNLTELKDELRAMLEDAGIHSSHLRMTQRQVEDALSTGRRPVELFMLAQEHFTQASSAPAPAVRRDEEPVQRPPIVEDDDSEIIDEAPASPFAWEDIHVAFVKARNDAGLSNADVLKALDAEPGAELSQAVVEALVTNAGQGAVDQRAKAAISSVLDVLDRERQREAKMAGLTGSKRQGTLRERLEAE